MTESNLRVVVKKTLRERHRIAGDALRHIVANHETCDVMRRLVRIAGPFGFVTVSTPLEPKRQQQRSEEDRSTDSRQFHRPDYNGWLSGRVLRRPATANSSAARENRLQSPSFAAALSRNSEPSRMYLRTVASDRWPVCFMMASSLAPFR
jgi:hypothetical protein